MDKEKIVIATITWARDAQEDKLLRRSIVKLAQFGRPIVVVDNGSGDAFVKYLKHLPNVQLHQCHSAKLLDQAKMSIETAHKLAETLGATYVLYTESDKEWFFAHQLEEFVRRSSGDPDVGIFVASRSDESFATFPDFQQFTERVVNRLFSELLNQKADFVYGPLLISHHIMSYLDFIRQDIGWGWRCFFLVAAHLTRQEIVPIHLYLPCPEDQRTELSKGDRIHRIKQLSQNIQGIVVASETNFDMFTV